MKKPSGKILIIDDTLQNISLLTKILEKNNYQVAAANNGEQGIIIANKLKPDLILLDIMMPTMDGYETCKRLKKKSKTKSIPVIFVSAKNAIEDILNGFAVGGIDYINKPFFEEEIIARIKTQVKIRKLTKKLKKSRRKAIKANKAKSSFLAHMSHELRTPMHGILSFAKLGISRADNLTPEKNKSYYQNIKVSAERLMGHVNNLLDLSKLELGLMEINYSFGNLMEITEHCVLEQQARLSELGISINYLPNNASNEMAFDTVRISQVITNFLSNAIKYTTQGGQIDITITENSHLSESILAIKNYGNQVPDNELESVFEKFVQSADKVSKTQGTGLGLAICKQIIEAHSGKIWLENHEDKEGGVTAFFILPNKVTTN